MINLTPREREVAELVMQGKKNREISVLLWIGEYTVKDHVTSIMRKCGVNSRRNIPAALASQEPQPNGVQSVSAQP